MITLYIIAAILGITLATIWFFIDKHSYYEDYEPFARFMARMCIPASFFTIAILLTSLIIGDTAKTKQVETPAKYTNQTYYIDNNNQLYIEQNGITKNFGGDITSKIEYRDLAKSPSIQFETKTKINSDKPDYWIPFKYETETKTSIAKIILPKSALTQKLTRVDVLNQSTETDLTLSN